MHQTKHTRWTRLAAPLAALVIMLPVYAESWTDSTGKFKIEADFVGVEGTNIVLKKPDGSTVNVPIARLSATSRTRAKTLYEQQKIGGSTTTPSPVKQASVTTPAISAASNSSGLSVAPPVPASVDPMPPFPENASLQETVTFVQTQLIAGHPEVLWHALPGDVRETVDSDEIRGKVGPFINQQAAAGEQSQLVIKKAIDLLLSKKQFVLNSPLMSQVPPNFSPLVAQAYDPAVGLVHELFQFSDALEGVEQRSVSEIVDEHGPRIGGHLKSIIALVPAEMVEGVQNSVVATEIDESSGTVTTTSPQGQPTETAFVKHGGRWIPKTLADVWIANKDDLDQKLSAGLEMANEQSAQSAMMSAMFVGMANSVIDPLAAAKTQEEFNQAVGQLMQNAGAMMQGAPAGAADEGGVPSGF